MAVLVSPMNQYIRTVVVRALNEARAETAAHESEVRHCESMLEQAKERLQRHNDRIDAYNQSLAESPQAAEPSQT